TEESLKIHQNNGTNKSNDRYASLGICIPFSLHSTHNPLLLRLRYSDILVSHFLHFNRFSFTSTFSIFFFLLNTLLLLSSIIVEYDSLLLIDSQASLTSAAASCAKTALTFC